MTPELGDDIRDEIKSRLWPASARSAGVFVILDAASDDRIHDAVMSNGADSVGLYSGNIPEALAKVAPYLVKLGKESSFTDYLIQNGWSRNWGIFLRSPAGLDELRKH